METAERHATGPSRLGQAGEPGRLLAVELLVLDQLGKGSFYADGPAEGRRLEPGQDLGVREPHPVHPGIDVEVHTDGTADPRGQTDEPICVGSGVRSETYMTPDQVFSFLGSGRPHQDHRLPDAGSPQSQGFRGAHDAESPDLGHGIEQRSRGLESQAVGVVLGHREDRATGEPGEGPRIVPEGAGVNLKPRIEAGVGRGLGLRAGERPRFGSHEGEAGGGEQVAAGDFHGASIWRAREPWDRSFASSKHRCRSPPPRKPASVPQDAPAHDNTRRDMEWESPSWCCR